MVARGTVTSGTLGISGISVQNISDPERDHRQSACRRKPCTQRSPALFNSRQLAAAFLRGETIRGEVLPERAGTSQIALPIRSKCPSFCVAVSLVESPVAICSSLIESNMLHRGGLAICVFWRITNRRSFLLLCRLNQLFKCV